MTGSSVRGPIPRVLFLDHVAEIGGAELSLLDIAQHFSGAGHTLLFSDGPFRTRLEEEAISVSILPAGARLQRVRRKAGLGQWFNAGPAVMKMVRELARISRDYQILYANSQKAFVIGALSTILTHKPLIWHIRDIMTAQHFSKLNRSLAVFLANRAAARVIANSEATRTAFIGSGGSAKRAHVVHNGINAAPFLESSSEKIALLKQALGLNGVTVVGLFSRISNWKGQHILLEAMKHNPAIHGLLVGAPLFPEDETYLRQIKTKCSELGLEDRVHFLGHRRDVADLMHACDIVVHTPTEPEPFGRVIVEAMLAGCAIVASGAGGILEIIEADQTGVLVPPGDSNALAAALARLQAQPDQARKLAGKAKAAALQRFALPSMLGKLEQHIQEVAAAHG